MANKDELLAYKNAEVAKIFPLYGTEPFKERVIYQPSLQNQFEVAAAALTYAGTVKSVDVTGKDSNPFRVVYEDGDSEWITLQELKSIVVKQDSSTKHGSKQEAPKSDKKRARSQKQDPEQAHATNDAAAAAQHQEHKKQKKHKHSKNSSQQQQKQHADPAAAAAAVADDAKQTAKLAKAAAKKAPPAAGATGAAATGVHGERGANAEQAKKQLKAQQQSVAGVTSFTIAAGAARAAADKTTAAGINKDAAAAAGSSKDAAAGISKDAAAAAAAAAGGSSKDAAAAAGKGGVTGKPSRPAATTPPPPAAAAAAPPTGTPGRKSGGKGAAGIAGASMSTADTQGMLAAIHQAAAPTADKLVHDRRVARMPYQGPGAAVLPAMSQVVVAGGHCYVTLHSAPRPRHSTTPGKSLSQQQQQPSTSAGHAAAVDYEAESAALLGELQRLLKHSGTDQRWLITVRVTLRSMQEGLPGFQAAWNAWAKRDELPVMTLVEAAGPFKAAGVMLEATALASA